MQRPKKSSSIYELDHWEGYDPHYKASRRKFSQQQQQIPDNSVFVTPPPTTQKTRFSPRVPPQVKQRPEEEQEGGPVRIPGSYRTKARKVLPSTDKEQDLLK